MKYASLRQGLVGAWCPSLGPSGNTLIDRSGYGNHGTLTNMDAGTDWVASRYGWALDFDGIDDHVSTFPAFPGLDFSVSFWAFAGTQTQNIVVVGDFSHSAQTGDGGSWVIQSENATSTRNYYLAFNAGNSNPIFYGNGATGLQMDIGLWSHFCYTKSGATLRGYKNGLLAWGPNTYASDNVFYKANSEFRIARWASTFTPTRCFLGQLDDMRIYRRVLAEPEIGLLATEPGIGLQPERASVFFGSTSNRRRRLLTGMA